MPLLAITSLDINSVPKKGLIQTKTDHFASLNNILPYYCTRNPKHFNTMPIFNSHSKIDKIQLRINKIVCISECCICISNISYIPPFHIVCSYFSSTVYCNILTNIILKHYVLTDFCNGVSPQPFIFHL